ncbi:helicase [Actinomyces sp. oral taxon 414]|nr:DEAD/DEAH box helicase [Actinomyces sp. oral taxon 414]ALC98318.1 helicase [Actinomyces sp. oral taxon 414]
MVRMISSESWPARVSDDQIIERVGQRTFLRGCRYVEQGRVRSVSVSPGGDILTGQVSGSGNRSYQTMVYCNSSDDPRPVWAGSCSCPVGTNCKHTVAVLLTVRRQAVPAPVGAGAGWEGTLTDLLRVSDSGARRPMALEVSQGDSVGWAHRRRGLSLLPLVRGRNGWNRQGASWSQVMGGGLDGDVDDDVLQAVQEIGRMAPRSFYYSDERVDLDDVPRRFWEILRRGVAAGLTLTTAQRGGQPVLVSEGLKAGVSLRIAQDDSLVVAPALSLEDVADLEGRVSDNPPIAGIGSPIHGFVVECLDGGLVLMPIEPAPSEVLARLLADTTRRITVPPSDVPRFKSEYLEPLSRAVPVVIHDPRIDIPEPPALHAVLRVTVDGAAHSARTEWLMRYRTADGEVRREEVLGDLDAAEATADPADNAPEPLAVSLPRRGRVWAPKGRRARTMPRAGRARAVSGLGGAGGDPADLRAPRDLAGERRLAREIIARLMPLVAKHGELWKRLNLSGIDTAHFMVRTLPVLKDMEGFETEVVGEVPDYREADGEVLVTTDVDEDADRPDWFSLKVHVKVGDEQVPIARLMAAVANGDGEVLLDSGAWIDLDRPEIRRLAALMAEGRALAEPDPKDPDALRVNAFQAGYYAELVALGVVGRAARRWQENVERLLALRPLAAGQDDGEGGGAGADPLEIPAPAGLNATLRPYQLEGYQWLDLLRSTGLGGILADDMGLGKTVQILAAIQRMIEQRRAAGGEGRAVTVGPAVVADAGAGSDEAGAAGAARPGPVLVVAPTSVVGTWVEQAGRFCPDLRVRAVTRTSAKRGTSFAEEAAQADVLVTSYTIARLDEEELTDVDLSWLVLDEAQFIKNHNSATYKAMRRLRAPSAVAITGTPLENSLMDLWSLLSVSAPGLLPGPDRFTQHYRRPIERGDTKRLEALRAHMHPFLLRRTKEEVAADLPEKSEQVLAVELPPAHRRAYDARLARERQKVLGLLETDTAQARFSALRSLTILRQMALDPALVEAGGADGGRSGRGAKASGKGRARRRKPTAKIEVLLDTLRPIVAEGHRALVFSQFTRYLTGVREQLEAEGLRTAYLDGTTVDRQGAIDSFRSGEADVFLISLKAGGFGLTLTEADYVFLLDPWWNPQVEEQAVDRVHRIGQDKPVMVYRLVSADTIEEKVMDLKEKKAELFDRVVEGAGAADEAAAVGMSRARLTAQEIRELVGG